MKNALVDLNNHLFSRIEALGDESLKGEKLKSELARSKISANLAGKVIDCSRLMLEAEKFSVKCKKHGDEHQLSKSTFDSKNK